MTPFGERLRQHRAARGIALKDMAKALGVSSAYLSALEHGHRGRPSWLLVQKIVGALHIIWDEAEELYDLADLSDPRVVVDTAGLPPDVTRLANRFARLVPRLHPEARAELSRVLDDAERALGEPPSPSAGASKP